MLIRFAAGSLVACIATAIASAGMLIFVGLNPQRFALILAIWCLVPCIWGLWAMLSPAGGFHDACHCGWGTILGVLAGSMAIFVVNLPHRVLGVALPTIARAFSVLVAALLYYLLWTMVRMAYKSLSGSSFCGGERIVGINPPTIDVSALAFECERLR